ncbi:MAG: DUF4258 domain-containing protein [Selenomonadaceae bacterium]|nr:DUF4258 domain-containing protein [Selenomonadaceae bacterium]
MIEIETLRRYSSEDKIFATNHASERFYERRINVADVHNAINTGEIIEQYPNDYPYPSCLVLGENLQGEKIHVVLSDGGTASRIITAYFPDGDKWSEDFRSRR